MQYDTTHDEYLWVFIIQQHLVGILAVVLVIFYRSLLIHMMHHRATWKHHIIHKTRST